MPLLAQLVVEYAADLTDLESGTQRALDLMSRFGSEAASGPEVLEGVFTELADSAEILSTAVADAGQAAASVSDDMAQASEATDTLATSFRDRAIAAADDFSARVEQLASPITNFASNLTERAGSALSDFGSRLQQAAQPVISFGERINAGISSAVSTLQDRFEQAKSSVTSFTSNLASSASDMVARVTSPFEQAGMVIAGFGIKAKEAVASATSAISERFSAVVQPVTSFASRVMEALPSLSGFGRGVSEAVSALPGFISRIGEGASALMRFGTSAVESGNNLFSGFGEKLASIGPNLLDFGSKIGMTVIGIQGLIQGAQQLGSAILEPNASMEQTTAAFKQLLGSSSAAQKELKSLSDMAASTPFEFPDLAQSEQQLIAFQIPLKDTHPLLMAIGDALSGLGRNTPATLDQVVRVFGQMNSAGKITTGDLQQLTQVGINGFQLLSDQMHKPVSVIRDMVSSGVIPAKDGIEALRAGMEQTFGGGMAAQAQTFNGLLSTFQDNVGLAMRSFTGPLFDQAKGALTNLGNLVSSPAFQQFATDMGQKVGTALQNVGTFVNTNVVPAFRNLQAAFQSPEFQSLQGAFANLGNVISTQLTPFLQPLVDKFQQVFSPNNTTGADTLKTAIKGVADGINNLSTFISGLDLSVIGPAVLGGIAAGFAIWAVFAGAAAIATLAATWPILAIVGGVALLTAGFIALYNNSAPFRGFIQGIGTVLQTLWSTLMAQLMPALQNLWSTLMAQLMPAWQQLQAAIMPIMPTLQFVGALIAGVVVGALGLLIGVIVGVVSAIAGAISGIVRAFVGVVQVISGIIQVIQGIVMFVYDLFTGNFSKLGADLGMIWGGIVGIFTGAINIIVGVISAGFGFISGFVSGFINTVIGFFTNLFDRLVGHSIIPDMINSIVQWFLGLPGKAISAIASIVGLVVGIFNMLYSAAVVKITTFVNGVISTVQTLPGRAGTAIGGIVNSVSGVLAKLPGMAAQWMTDFGNSIVNGINNFIGNVGNAAGNIANAITSHLHFSLPEEGPLSTSDKWMPDFGNMLASGLNDQVSNVKAAAMNVASAIAGASGTANIAVNGSGGASAGGVSVSRSPQVVYVTVQSSQSDVYLDKEKVGKSVTNWQKDVMTGGRRNR